MVLRGRPPLLPGPTGDELHVSEPDGGPDDRERPPGPHGPLANVLAVRRGTGEGMLPGSSTARR